jgi:hypothetical protein
MKKILALDISSKTGWATLEGEKGSDPALLLYGKIGLPLLVKGYCKREGYPKGYTQSAEDMVSNIAALIKEHKPDELVIEETNKSRNRYSQKYLEFVHAYLIQKFVDRLPLRYVNTSAWRKNQGCILSEEDKAANRKLNKAKKDGKPKPTGIKGKTTPKHAAVRAANKKFNLNLKLKDNDMADALLLGASFFNNVSFATGE